MTIPDYFAEEAFQDSGVNPEKVHRGQARMAYRLAEAYTGRLLFVRGLGWLYWNGCKWVEDDIDRAKSAVLDVLRDALAESLNDQDLRRDVRKCESSSGVSGVLDLAASIPALRASIHDLDADPYLLNCANGTLDLRTRELRPHDPADKLTKITNGAYDPAANGQLWQEFLESILPNDDERGYLQRVIGQGVFGAVREHLFPVLTGTGQNGKGTAYGAIAHALGNYAIPIDPSMLMATDKSKPGGPEIMALMGARLVIGSETEEGRSLDAATMKRFTGGDKMTARNLYQPVVEWEPTHQIIYVTNHLPKLKGNDPAVWRRVRVIPFDVVIPEHKKDGSLPERLKLDADSILTWAAAGWFDYIDRGSMDEPESVKLATDSYQTESDAVKRFVQARLVTSPHAHAKSRELFTLWQEWATFDGAAPMSESLFGKELDRLGYTARRTKTGMVRAGIGLPTDSENEGEV
ncbi:DNA primase family protein [Neomicrococcus lactis]|uniref:DNA primase family protein n=1 Tax=Neomicrococcus lactis TaxID=732241 RepID=UPI002300D673|nr:phage/plasmid primase, P4 family [Neomicrococcus lactis]